MSDVNGEEIRPGPVVGCPCRHEDHEVVPVGHL